MASVASFRRGLAKAVEALNYDVSGAAKGRVKSFAMNRLQPEIGQIAHAVSKDAYTKAALIGGAVGVPAAAAAYLAGRKSKMEKHAGVGSKIKQLLGRETKGEKIKRVLREMPEEIREHVSKKVKSFQKHVKQNKLAYGAGAAGAAGLLAGSGAGYAAGKRK